MPSFSKQSAAALATTDFALQRLFNEVIKTFDCTIICGARSEADQNKAFLEGKSKQRWPTSKHNTFPSRAVDVAPAPIDWNDLERFVFFAGYVKCTADRLGIRIRWGGDWNSDTRTKDEKFRDYPHFELEG